MTPVTVTTTTGAATPPPPTILKTDALGRVKAPAARREALLDEFERSSATAPAFARLAGVNYQTPSTWIQNRPRPRARTAGDADADAATAAGPTPVPTAVRWLEAVVETDADAASAPPMTTADGPGASSLCLCLPGGARLEIRGPEQVALAAALLRALERGATSHRPVPRC